MPAYSRDSGGWTETIMRQRESADWSGDDALGFVWDSGAWVQFQAPAGDADLLQPTSLVATPGDLDASFTWANPTPLSAATTPTHVQYRIPETTAVWTEITYPITAAEVGYLSPATTYQFQVRYVLRDEDGVIDLTGYITETFFTTTALVGPGTPAADPLGSGPDATVPWGPPSGGTAGAVGSADCWWEYVIQEFDTLLYTWSDTASTASIAGDIGELDIDFVAAGFACNDTLRWKFREVCDSVPAAWEYSEAFNVVCDYVDPCGGISQTQKFAAAPFTDAVMAMPKYCWNGTTFKVDILDYITDTNVFGKLSGYGHMFYIAGDWQIQAGSGLSAYGEPMVAAHIPLLVPLGSSVPSLTSDFSFSMMVNPDIVPAAGSGAPVKIAEIGKTIKIYMYASGGSVTFSASVPKQGGGTFTLTSSTTYPTDTMVGVGLTIDQDGNKLLYTNGELDITDATVTRADFGALKGDVELYGNDLMKIQRVAIWDRVLSAAEMAAAVKTNSPYTQFMLDLGADAHYVLEEFDTSIPDVTYDDQVAALTGISVYYPMDTELT